MLGKVKGLMWDPSEQVLITSIQMKPTPHGGTIKLSQLAMKKA